MKKHIILTAALLILTLPWRVMGGEQEQMQSAAEQAMAEIMYHVMINSKSPDLEKPSNGCRIVIVDTAGRRIREEMVDRDDFCGSATLAPMIFRCEFLTAIGNTRYYLLSSNAAAKRGPSGPEKIQVRGNFQPVI